MFLHLSLWLVAFAVALVLPIIIIILVRLAKVKVWIKMRPKKGAPVTEIGYLTPGDEETAAEIHLSGSGRMPAIGRVQAEVQAARAHGNVDVLESDWNDDSAKPVYRRSGHISFGENTAVDRYGYIYRENKGKRKELVGYCARPSDPDTPTIYGERTWRSLWLRCTLHAYFGLPASAKNDPPTLTQPTATRMLVVNGIEDGKPEETPSAALSQEEQTQVPPQEEQSPATSPQEEPQPVPQQEEQHSEPTQEEQQSEPSQEDQQQPEPPQEESQSAEPTPEEEEDSKGKKGKKEKKSKKDKRGKKEKKSKKDKKNKKEPDVVCYFKGFHSSRKDVLPPEARACAYALLAEGRQPQNYSESYRNQPYGWRDTALLTSVIYTLLYLVLYTVNTAVLGLPLLGNDMRAVGILTAAYFVLWALVRLIKVESIENSNTFQPKLDLFNKNLGLRWVNISILTLAALVGTLSYFYYDLDFMPLATAIATGVSVNMSLKNANKRWLISSTFGGDDTTEEEGEEPKNPEGDIARTYEWQLDSPQRRSGEIRGTLTLFFSARHMEDIRFCNPFFSQRKERSDKQYISQMIDYIDEHRDLNARVRYAARSIARQATAAELTPMEKIQFTLDFVQEPNIQFVRNSDCKTVHYYDDYIRYPDETLYDKEGEWNSKSLLALMLFHEMGYNTLYMFSRKYDHAGIGIELPADDIDRGWYGDPDSLDKQFIEFDGHRYLFCETTGDRFRIGGTIEGMSHEDFEDRLPIPAAHIRPEGDETRIYNWDLDSQLGNKLHGTLTLSFDPADIDALRAANPFLTYGQDANTYEMNVRAAFDYLAGDPRLGARVQAVADYVNTTAANLPELDCVQFALDFAQEPNITYKIDEQSEPIEYAKEYMRFPDEVLYDKEGDCDCKSSLTAAIFRAMGYKVLFMLSAKLKHAAIAVEMRDEWLDQIKPERPDAVVREVDGVRYIYCETTGDHFRVGLIKPEDSIMDFETTVQL